MTAELTERYAEALDAFATAPDEEGRVRAYEIGRAAIALGLGVLDLARMHTRALVASKVPAARDAEGWEFFTETLAPFEMALSGFREANQTLQRFAATLEQRVSSRTAELRVTEASLRSQTKVLRSILESMADGVAVADATGRFVLSNSAGAALVGPGRFAIPADEWPPGFAVFEPDEQTPISLEGTPLSRALRGDGSARDVELFVRTEARPKGIHLSVTASPLRDENGVAAGAVVAFRDVTSRRNAEEAARRADERLYRAQKLDAVGQLAGGVAHDFNNLLAVITTYGHLLLDELPADDPNAADVQAIVNAARSAASLTQQLLAFSRKQVLQPTVVDLNAIVEDVARMLKRTIGENIELATSLDPTIARVLVDRGQVEQILMNLAVNARDAMPSGGRLTIETAMLELPQGDDGRSSLAPGSHVMLAVTDTGVGMDEATRARLFEPFFTTKEVGRGTGLGLATVYGIVQQSDGHVSVYSEVGHGTSFKIYLPPAPSSTSRVGSDKPIDLVRGSETVLLVEDDDAVRAVTQRVLTRNGYTVLVASHPSEALAICRDHPGEIHALVSDVMMPGMSGPVLAGQLGRLRRDMVILFTSGYTSAGIMRQGALPPDAAFLQKPFAPNVLLTKLKSLLSTAPKDPRA